MKVSLSPDWSGNHFDYPGAKRKENQNIAMESGSEFPKKYERLLLNKKRPNVC
jgi:hypothetical protein